MLENNQELEVFLIRREPAPLLLGSFKFQDTIVTTEDGNPFSRLQEKEHSEKSGSITLLPFTKLM